MHMPAVDGTRWRDRRAELDLAPADAAQELRIAKGTLRNIETVRGFNVSLRVIYRAARFYDRSVAWLKGEDDNPNPEPEPAKEPRAPSGDPRGPSPRRDGKRDHRGPRRDEMKAAS